jgi:hypothetical protein
MNFISDHSALSTAALSDDVVKVSFLNFSHHLLSNLSKSFSLEFLFPHLLQLRRSPRKSRKLPALLPPSSEHPTSTMKNKEGWDGKMRVEPKAVITNPEALEDSDYSDPDAPPVDEIQADEGTAPEELLVRRATAIAGDIMG